MTTETNAAMNPHRHDQAEKEKNCILRYFEKPETQLSPVTLGDATQSSLRKIWNGPEYRGSVAFFQCSTSAYANCVLRWSL
jgi:hypothetical protein